MRTCCGAGAFPQQRTLEERGWDGARSTTNTSKVRNVAILPDNDDAGRAHGWKVVRNLLPVAKAVKIIELPGLPEKGDIVNWADDGHTKKELLKLVKKGATLTADSIPEDKPKRGDKVGSDLMLFTRLGDLLDEEDEEVEWLVADHLPAGGVSMVVAKPKVGKSTMARCLALAVARGSNFLNCETSQGSVLYLALEEKRSEVRRHFRVMGATGDDEISIFCGFLSSGRPCAVVRGDEEKSGPP